MGRKVKLSRRYGRLDVRCPMSFSQSDGGHKMCARSCAWFRIVGDNAYCKEAEIGEVVLVA
jgi:hypothetical protein